MSAAALLPVALLGVLVGLAAPPLARRFTTPSAATPTPSRPALLLCSAVAGVVFAGLAVALGDDPALPVFLAVAAVGVVLAVVDLACLRLPDPLVVTTALLSLGGFSGAAVLTGDPGRLLGPLAGAAVAGTAHVLLALLPGSRLGFGDVKLAAVLGLPLGWLGRDALLAGLFLPHLLHGGMVLGLLAARRVRRDTLLPLGPALLAGAWLAVLLG